MEPMTGRPFERGVWVMLVGALIAGFGWGLERGVAWGLIALGILIGFIGFAIFVADS